MTNIKSNERTCKQDCSMVQWKDEKRL